MFGFENRSEKQYELLRRKGVYPYEHITSWDRFEDTELPPIESFYSSLNMSGVSESDYQHAQRVWEEFWVRNIGDYHDLYLRTDLVLLAKAFEAFRETCLRHYSLDPAHFYMAPGLTWKARLKKTGVRSELLTDPDMLLMFERGIRGGITQGSIDIHQQIINMREISTILIKNPPTFNTSMPTIFMVGPCCNRFQLAISNGLK